MLTSASALPSFIVHLSAAQQYFLFVLDESYERYVAAIDTARLIIQSSPFVRDDAYQVLGDQFLRIVVDWSLSMALGLEFGYPVMLLLPHPDNARFARRTSGIALGVTKRAREMLS